MPLSYSKSPAGMPYDLHPNADEDRFREGHAAFFSGQLIPKVEWIELGPSAEQIAARNAAILSELDSLLPDAPTPARPIIAQAAVEDDEPTYEIIEDEPVLTPYDRRLKAVREADAEREACEPGTEVHCIATARLAEAKGKLKAEIDRDGDDDWRFRRSIDEWRKTDEGREERNTSRRKVRSEPNARLTKMTPEQRAAHKRAQDNDRKWEDRQRKKGWTEEQIADGLEKRRLKRLTKDAWNV